MYGFDVQEQAIQSTQKRLEATGLQNVELLQCSHAEFSRVVDQAVAAAMFNLGYLPRSDHSPLPVPAASGVSPLSTPSAVTPASDVSPPPPSWAGGGAVLLWVALGIVLALGITFVTTRWYRRAD